MLGIQSNKLWMASALVVTLLAATSAGFAQLDLVNLDLRQTDDLQDPNNVFAARLYATSDPNDVLIRNMDVILTWDPAVLGLIGKDDTGGPGWNPGSGFEGFQPLNDTFDDGNAIYSAYAPIGTDIFATPPGLLVTTFRFDILGDCSYTPLAIVASLDSSETGVWGLIPGENIIGELDELRPDWMGPTGDVNCDGSTNALDIDAFVMAMAYPADYATNYPGCDIEEADCNCDGTINGLDIDPFVMLLNGN